MILSNIRKQRKGCTGTPTINSNFIENNCWALIRSFTGHRPENKNIMHGNKAAKEERPMI